MTPLTQQLQLNRKPFMFEVDSGAKDNFCSRQVWTRLGKPILHPACIHYVSATGNHVPVLGTFNAKASLESTLAV